MLKTLSKHLENKSKFCEFPDGGDTNLIHLNYLIDIVVQHLFERSDYRDLTRPFGPQMVVNCKGNLENKNQRHPGVREILYSLKLT